MKTHSKILAAIVALIVVAIVGVAIFVGTLDANAYRPQLVEALSNKLGRAIKLDGPISLSLGLSEVRISVRDAAIANPDWASRPMMVGMGQMELGVRTLPLLSKNLDIRELVIKNADIHLEVNADGERNWAFGPATHAAAQPAGKEAAKENKKASAASETSLSITKLSIVDSQITMRDQEGKTTSFSVTALELGMQGLGAVLRMRGDLNGTPLMVSAKTGIENLLSRAPFPFDAEVIYGPLNISGHGQADLGSGKYDVSYNVSAGHSKVNGDLSAKLGGGKTRLRGNLNSPHLDFADFKAPEAKTTAEKSPAGAPKSEEATNERKRLFSDAPLPFDALRTLDINLDLAINELAVGGSAINQVTGKLIVENGNLSLAPMKASMGTAPVDLQLKLNAARSPAQLTVGIISDGIDLAELQKMARMPSVMTGRSGVNIQLAGQGDSSHDIAASLGGVAIITAEKGQILSGALARLSTLFLPLLGVEQGGNDALNCLAARFIVKNGVMADNGMLLDSATSTVEGKGNINLGSETINLTLVAHPKLKAVSGVNPALTVGGELTSPSFAVNAAEVVKNVVGSLLSGEGLNLSGSVPKLLPAPAGQNACVYTLDHPKGGAPSGGVLSPDPVSQAGQKIKDMGNKLVNGLFGQ